MQSERNPYEAHRIPALSAAGMAAEALARRAPHVALAAAQEAARRALLALGTGPRRPANDDLRRLTDLAATPPGDLDGKPGEREAAVRRALAAVERLLPQGPEAADDGSAPPHMDGEARPRVLVVEDEFFIADDIAEELRGVGLDVLGPVPSAAEALSLIKAAAADGGITAAVLDIALQDGRVTPVADALAAMGVPFVFATGYGPEYDGHGHVGAPMLQKPFGGPALVEAVAGLIAGADGAVAAAPAAVQAIRLSQPIPVVHHRPGAAG